MTGNENFLPYGQQVIEEDDLAAVCDVLRSPYLTTGPAVGNFEAKLRDVTGGAHAVSCSSGTAALHLAALALDLSPGDKVAVPAVTFIATANAVRYVGADVVFTDVDPDTGLMTEACLKEAIQKTEPGSLKAVFPVHLAGQCFDPEAIYKLARENGLKVVDDASHALGSTYKNESGRTVPVGRCDHADMIIFSFHPVKTIAMGEGGAITTNSERFADSLENYRNHGMHRHADKFENRELAIDPSGQVNPWYYEMPALGFNYRASDIHCALGVSQLEKLDRFVQRRRELARYYDSAIGHLSPAVRPLTRTPGCDPAWHLYIVLVDFTRLGKSRAQVMEILRNQNIGTQVHYIPVSEQPYYRKQYGIQELPGAHEYYQRCLSLPLSAAMSTDDVDKVVDALDAL